MPLIQQVRRSIAQHHLFDQRSVILVALSGGADSTALLLILRELGYEIHALHCNFHLRGEESDRDQHFAETLCRQYDVPIIIKHFDTTGYAKSHKVSLEMAARELRYAWFEEQRVQLHAQGIAVAHHRDDQAETLMLNIIRGTGLRGLAGMQYKNGYIFRPLLDVSRQDILDYLSLRHQQYVTDSTNLERDALRNRIRLDVLPLLATLNPNIHETLSTLSANIQDALPVYEMGLQQMQNAQEKRASSPAHDALPNSPYRYFPISSASLTLLHEWTTGCGFTRTQLENILQGKTGSLVESATHRLLHDRTHFILQDKSIPQPTSEIVKEIVPREELRGFQKFHAYLDNDKLHYPLTTRRALPSDRFTPYGMNGSKLLSDYLTDLKLNRFQKEVQEVVTDARGEIVWVVGYASNHHFRITESTKNILVMAKK